MVSEYDQIDVVSAPSNIPCTHRIHVWYIYLDVLRFVWKSRYTIRGSYVLWGINLAGSKHLISHAMPPKSFNHLVPNQSH